MIRPEKPQSASRYFGRFELSHGTIPVTELGFHFLFSGWAVATLLHITNLGTFGVSLPVACVITTRDYFLRKYVRTEGQGLKRLELDISYEW